MTSPVNDARTRGDALAAAGDHAGALEAYLAARDADPSRAVVHYAIGNSLRHLGRVREALAAYDEAIRLEPNFAIARHNRATCLLQIGDFVTGFREYEWRKACPGFAEDPRYRLPNPWRGEPLAGRTIYLYPELYQGDLIQFSRYAVVLERIGARVILAAPTAMHALLQTLSPTLRLVDRDAPAPDYDLQSALLTVPALLGASLEMTPPVELKAEPARVAKWRARIGPHGFKVGIAWQGSALATQRSFPLAVAAERLARVPGVRLISLQKHNGLEQLDALSPGLVETLGDDFDPGPDVFVDTAAAMTACDLFITPDTSVVHVAGGLGVRTWLGLPFAGDWRWLERQTDTPWYPSVRIFRQPAADDWAAVFDNMAAELATHAAEGFA